MFTSALNVLTVRLQICKFFYTNEFMCTHATMVNNSNRAFTIDTVDCGTAIASN